MNNSYPYEVEKLKFIKDFLINNLKIIYVKHNREPITPYVPDLKLIVAYLHEKTLLYHTVNKFNYIKYGYTQKEKKEIIALYPYIDTNVESLQWKIASRDILDIHGCLKHGVQYLCLETIPWNENEHVSNKLNEIYKNTTKENLEESNKSIVENIDLIMEELITYTLTNKTNLRTIVSLIDSQLKKMSIFSCYENKKYKKSNLFAYDASRYNLVRELQAIKKDAEINNISIHSETEEIFKKYEKLFELYNSQEKE